MESSTSRTAEGRREREDIANEIARLQSKLRDLPPDAAVTSVSSPPTSPKRKRPDSTTLVPPTPSPKKRKIAHRPLHVTRPGQSGARFSGAVAGTTVSAKIVKPQSTKLSPSNLLKNLAKASRVLQEGEKDVTTRRSSGFADRPPTPNINNDQDTCGQSHAPKRDDRLALVEDLEPGPVDHIPPADDPNFDKLEPNSGIRLSSRTIPHQDLQNYLTGRFYLSPSQLYSHIRLLPDKLGYDVPVPGDWTTIAVVAERGPLRYSKAPVVVGPDEGDEAEKKGKWKGKGSINEGIAKPTGKKYVNLKLIDFGSHSRSSSSATGGKAIIRGDAFLSLLLFESDSFDLVSGDGNRQARKIYKGGSRGAFESMSKLKEGDVIALLNPRILKPHQRANDSPHPENNILAITPESASSIMNIGRARDLGMCTVLKRDNTVCGSWVDKRVSDVCEYHVQHAVERRRAGRAEFSIGTMGLSITSAPKRKPVYDPARQWGLKPEPVAGSATYIVSGHVVNDSQVDSRTLFVSENIGREGQAKAARKMSKRAADRTLMSLLERDKEGMKAVMKAREVGKKESNVRGKMDRKGKVKGEDQKGEDQKGKAREFVKGNEVGEISATTKNAYTAEMIKRLGFDPIAMSGQCRGLGDSDVQKKLRSLEALQSSRKGIELGPRPGHRIRSNVIVPNSKNLDTTLHDLDSPADELPEHLSEREPDVMIDLDD
ncbi:hypothetical protein C0992_000278 [Termitomyces sp. T32_za158]|nr:hypothetical protein C0992_000278 [Termitomyces sp. T32_za158]